MGRAPVTTCFSQHGVRAQKNSPTILDPLPSPSTWILWEALRVMREISVYSCHLGAQWGSQELTLARDERQHFLWPQGGNLDVIGSFLAGSLVVRSLRNWVVGKRLIKCLPPSACQTQDTERHRPWPQGTSKSSLPKSLEFTTKYFFWRGKGHW